VSLVLISDDERDLRGRFRSPETVISCDAHDFASNDGKNRHASGEVGVNEPLEFSTGQIRASTSESMPDRL
jgi:hypothetical protein